MRYHIAVAVVLIGLLAAPAGAWHCPADMARIDRALAAEPDIPPEDLAEAKRLRAEGEELHAAGRHDESIKVLLRAMQLLGMVPKPPDS